MSNAEDKQLIIDVAQDMGASKAFMTMQINRALDISKIENNVKLMTNHEIFNIEDILIWAVNTMKCVQSRVLVILKAKTELIERTIVTDKGWMQENLLCLLSNATKYSPSGSTVYP
jgi:signal transduction histidine kinase